MVTSIPIVRAVHLNVYLAVLREIGAPVERLLAAAGLPAPVEEMPGAYLHVPRVLDCVSSYGGSAAAMELGFAAAQRSTLECLRPAFRRAILDAACCWSRLEAMVVHCRREDGALVGRLVQRGQYVQVICDLAEFHDSAALAYSEWLQLQGMISIVRSVAGDGWCPEEITFVSRIRPPEAALAAYGDARFRLGWDCTSILVPKAIFALPCVGTDNIGDGQAADVATPPDDWGFAECLREMIKPYLANASPQLGDAAALLGMSERTLQRRLQRQGLSFTGIVSGARYQLACELLADPSIKIIDVASAAGYEYPQHFTRAFRRVSGLTPRDYRHHMCGQ